MRYVYPATLTRDEAGRVLVRFPDLPEALTDGADEEEALCEAADCLTEALLARVADREPIPHPSPVGPGQYEVAPEPMAAMKAALQAALDRAGMSPADLGRRMGLDQREVRRMLDPHHPTKLPRLTAALRVLGCDVQISVTTVRPAA